MIARLRRGARLVIATHNEGKRMEFAALFAPFGIECLSAAALGLAEPVEDAPDFAGNAQIKARAAAQAASLPALADDSGLSVAALGGAPGVHSARFAREHGGYPQAMAEILAQLGADRRAAFACALCLASPEGETATYLGFTHGMLARTPCGEGGFGYDPIFIPLGETRSYAEMTRADKSAISHRARAFRQLAAALIEPD
jgi:XTP/dITP diphosphohydrolase